MNLKDFKKLEQQLGHPPTQKEVREHEAKKQMCSFKTPECTLGCYATKGRKLLTSAHFRFYLN